MAFMRERLGGSPKEYGETYCSVVSWHTVCLLMIISQALCLATQGVDYINDFVQSPIGDQEVSIEMPTGFKKEWEVLKLNKRCNFYNHLRSKLEHPSVGFVHLNVDQCLFISDKVIVLVYVDDTLLFARNQQDIENVTDNLREQRLVLDDESNVAGSLGIHVERLMDRSLHPTRLAPSKEF
jgi:hypothetical protein